MKTNNSTIISQISKINDDDKSTTKKKQEKIEIIKISKI
jgi:hypothetical protein